MDKSFYVSGFLYNFKSQQILLIQSTETENNAARWSMVGGKSNKGESASVAFQRIISKTLNLELKSKDIYPIYDYFHDFHGGTNYVFYAEVKKPHVFNACEGMTPSWVTFSETLKLLFTDHTKQDVIVGGRVIDLKWRISRNIQ